MATTSEGTTVYLPPESRDRLGDLHNNTARHPNREPLYRTIDRALDALDSEVNK